MLLTLLILAAILGLIPAVIAARKGQSFIAFWIFGALLLIVALPVALLMKDRRPKCPECAEVVQPEAKRCPHCQAEIEGRIVLPPPVVVR